MRLWDLYAAEIPPFVAEAMDLPEMQRLRHVGMNCGCEYTAFPTFQALMEPYSRLDHSVGVALLVWRFTGDVRQTLAGLFHDIRTPCFAHVVDFMLGDSARQETTEDGTGAAVEASGGIRALLRRLGLTVEDVTDYHRYPVADNDAPRLSADRLEYTLGNLVNFRRISRDDARRMLDALTVLRGEDGAEELGFLRPEEARAFAEGALEMGRIYVSEADRFAMQTLAELLTAARDAGVIGMEDLWRDEPYLIGRLRGDARFREAWEHFRRLRGIAHVPGGMVVRAKKRWIDPLVAGRGRLSRTDLDFRAHAEAFLREPQDTPMAGLV